MKNLRCYWAYLPANSSGEYAALGKLAERKGFELAVRFASRLNGQASLMSSALLSKAVVAGTLGWCDNRSPVSSGCHRGKAGEDFE